MNDLIGLTFLLIFVLFAISVFFLLRRRQKSKNKILKEILFHRSKVYFENLKGNIYSFSDSKLIQRQHPDCFDLFFGDYGLIIINKWWAPIYIPLNKKSSDLELLNTLEVKCTGHKKSILYKNIEIEMEGIGVYKRMHLVAKPVNHNEIDRIDELLSELTKNVV